jgi:hypothetical protein
MKQNKPYKTLRRLVKGGTTRLQKPDPLSAEKPFERPPQPSVGDNADSGIMRLDKSNHLPTALAEVSEHGDTGLMPGPLVITITLAAIVFIGIITWFIAHMPDR